MKDLVILVADKNMLAAVRGALRRPQRLGIRPISFDFRVHPGRDGGVRTTGPELVAGESARFAHAMVLFDFEGCGAEGDGVEAIEAALDERLQLLWKDRAKAFVIAPEIDIWIWGADSVLAQVVGWTSTKPIRDWLLDRGFQFSKDKKPLRPKEAAQALVSSMRLARSSALYENITSEISLKNCCDQTFLRVRDQLRTWFPIV